MDKSTAKTPFALHGERRACALHVVAANPTLKEPSQHEIPALCPLRVLVSSESLPKDTRIHTSAEASLLIKVSIPLIFRSAKRFARSLDAQSLA